MEDNPPMRFTCSSKVATLAIIVLSAVGLIAGAQSRTQGAALPVYKVGPFWPNPLPNKWIMQGVPTMVTDKDDHIWVLNRPRPVNPDESCAPSNPPPSDCCLAAPAR